MTAEEKKVIIDRRRKAERLLRQEETNNYSVQGWHPAYRNSLLLRVDPKHRSKVEADMDFREMMSKAPIEERQFCTVCGSLFSPDAAFCRRCGNRRGNGPEPAQPKVSPLSRIAEALLKAKTTATDFFGKWDTDGNGSVTVKELRQGIEQLGLYMEYEDIRKILAEVDKAGNTDGSLPLTEIENALQRRVDRKSAGTLFAPRATAPRRRGTVGSSAPPPRSRASAETMTSPRDGLNARSVTPTQTRRRMSVSGSPEDSRRSLLRHIPEDKLIREEKLLVPRTEYVKGDMRATALCPEVEPGIKWDRRPNRERSQRPDEEVWTGEPRLSGVALDPAAVAALQNERERMLLLALEENIISGVQDASIDRIELTTPIPKDLQALVQHIADYYMLQYEIAENNEEETVNMTLLRTPESRVRSISIAKMCEAKGDQQGDGGEAKVPTPRSAKDSKGDAKDSKGDAKRPSERSKNSKTTPPRATTPPRVTTPRSNASKKESKVSDSKEQPKSTTPRSNRSGGSKPPL